MKSELRERAIKLRIEEELSFGEIKERLGVSKSTLSYWLREFPLNEEKILELRRRGWKSGEASRERFRETMRQKREQKAQLVYEEQSKKLNKLSSDAFFTAGLMLYAAEGDKKNAERICLANTDPEIIKFFIRWMERFLYIGKEALKVQLHLYENMDVEAETGFWRTSLGWSKEQFYKPSIRKLRKASFSYRESYRHGTCSLYLLGTEKKLEIAMAIRAFFEKAQEIW